MILSSTYLVQHYHIGYLLSFFLGVQSTVGVSRPFVNQVFTACCLQLRTIVMFRLSLVLISRHAALSHARFARLSLVCSDLLTCSESWHVSHFVGMNIYIYGSNSIKTW